MDVGIILETTAPFSPPNSRLNLKKLCSLLTLLLAVFQTTAAEAKKTHRYLLKPAHKCARLLRNVHTYEGFPRLPHPEDISLDHEARPIPGVRDAVVVAILSDSHVLMNLRGGEVGHREWGIIGGKVDEGETLREALMRELHEETRLESILDPKIIHVHYHYDSNAQKMYRVFVVKADHDPSTVPVIGEVDKVLDIRWFHLDKLPERLFSEFHAYEKSLR